MDRTIEVENPDTPGKTAIVDADAYTLMYAALMRVVPRGDVGLTAAEITDRVKFFLPEDQFRQGATAGWWAICVQRDLEAKGVMKRLPTDPVTFARV